MYKDHVPMIASAMRTDTEAFKRGVMFAAISARMRFNRVPALCEQLRYSGESCPCLWGWKKDTYKYLQKHGDSALASILPWKEYPSIALRNVTKIPGMGLVKGGFVLQLMGMDIGCLDTRNEARLGLDMRPYRTRGKKDKLTKSYQSKAERYAAITAGQAETLWDDWCVDTAEEYGLSPQAVSQIHVDAIL